MSEPLSTSDWVRQLSASEQELLTDFREVIEEALQLINELPEGYERINARLRLQEAAMWGVVSLTSGTGS